MMLPRLLSTLLLIVLPALAYGQQTARIRSGEHAAFSRLVIEAANLREWHLNRLPDGYVLTLDGSDWRFDLTGVFDRIPRTRLTGAWADPDTGGLRLSLDCACHATAFTFRPGVLVIDISDGPPPAGSAFELSPAGMMLDPLAPAGITRPRRRQEGPTGYDWLSASEPAADQSTPPADPGALPSPDLAPLRDALIAQIGKGMAAGAIDPAIAGPAAPAVAGPPRSVADGLRVGADPLPRLSDGSLPGFAVGTDGPGPKDVSANGSLCPSDEMVAVQDWGDASLPTDQLAKARAGIIGEFDRPDEAAALAAVRTHLFLGFGAEAAAILQQYPVGSQEDRAILRSLARLVDGHTDPDGAFASMAGCGTTAAFWAVLSDGRDKQPARAEGVVRAFSALPPHLRRSLGPLVMQRLTARGDRTIVPALQSAVDRLAGPSDRGMAVARARQALTGGQTTRAEALATEVLQDPGPETADALITFVDAKVAQRQPVTAETVIALRALTAEHQGDSRESDLWRALVLAEAAMGKPVAALSDLPRHPQGAAALWGVIADMSDDAGLLSVAILPADARPDGVAAHDATTIARRLLGLGFADAAQAWLGPPTDDWTAEQRQLSAEASLRRTDAPAALRHLAGAQDPASEEIRARALNMLGQTRAAATAWARAGEGAAAARALIWAGDWASASEAAPAPWQQFAAVMAREQPSNPPTGLLGRSGRLIEESMAERSALSALLGAIPPVVASGPGDDGQGQ